jgi:uncharacterized protein (TIGR01777 family)
VERNGPARDGGTDAVDLPWDPAAGRLDAAALDAARLDAVIHLAGANIGQRWTSSHRREIRESRVAATSLLARTLASLDHRPPVLVSASAVGIYGHRGDEPLDESSALGAGFLTDVGRAWESSADPARAAGIRVVHPRSGVVLHPDGGMLARLVPVFSLGAGGKVGSGRQWLSWISLEDWLRAIEFLLSTDALAGPVNVTSPAPVTNADFTRALARVLRRPAIATVPELAVKVAFGEMGVEMLLGGQRVLPRRLQEAGFRFEHPTLEEALRHELRGE